MSRSEVTTWFDKIGEWMVRDIQREIALARASDGEDGKAALAALGIPAGGGNLLAALGLVSYTEALGRLRVWNEKGSFGNEVDCFNAFFDRMAVGRYREWWDAWDGNQRKTIYHVLRNGLVHEYHPKVKSEFHIGSGDEELGIAEGEEKGVLVFRVNAYFRDFQIELRQLKEQLLARTNPEAEIPPPSGMPGSVLPSGSQAFGPTSSVASGPVGPMPSRGFVVSPTSNSDDDKVR
jgi:hypothetical protein